MVGGGVRRVRAEGGGGHTSRPTEESSCCLEPDFVVLGDLGSAAPEAVESMVVSGLVGEVGDVGTAAAVEALDLRGGIVEGVGVDKCK